MEINRLDIIMTEELEAIAGVTDKHEQISEARLIWLGHAARKTVEDHVVGPNRNMAHNWTRWHLDQGERSPMPTGHRYWST